MKNKFLRFIIIALVFVCTIFLFGCDLGAGDPPNYNNDVQMVSPENITAEHFIAKENTTYYTSDSLSLMMEVNGAFLEVKYFYLDGNKRVYDDLYLYKADYFYAITGDYKNIYAALGDSADTQYAEEEKQSGEDIQINVIQAGIYKIIFDVDTLKFDMEYKAPIDTPRYYTINNCQIYTVATEWMDMSVNPDNEDEFVIKNFYVGANEFISFQDRTHTSLYKNSLDESCNEKYGSYAYPTTVINVGGNYNIYINRKTYVVRLELLNPDTATYSCVYYDGNDFIELEPYDVSVPYVFRKRIVVDVSYTTLPNFHTTKYKTYDLTVIDETNLLISGNKYHYFKTVGTYDVVVNLKTFEISVELLPE